MIDEFCLCEDCERHRKLKFEIQLAGESTDEGRRITAMSHVTLPFIKLTFWQWLQIQLAPIFRAMR